MAGLLALSLAWGSIIGPAKAATTVTAATAGIADNADVLGAERLFSAWLEAQIAYRGLPGVTVGVVADQKLIWSRGFGYADVATHTPMTPLTKFRMASNSKLFTAIAIMQLREEGKLGLDDPVVKYLPWFKPKPAGDDDGPITIEQLLSHSSGLQREAGDHWVTYKFPSREQLQHLMTGRESPFAPSVRWKYSNLAYAVAGMIVEQVSGQTWADYVQAHILDPLGMHDTSVDKNVPGLATAYARRMPDGTREVLPFIDSRAMAGAAGITSTLEDMAKFVSAEFRRGPRGGAQVVSGGSWREMQRVRSLGEDWTSGTGLGFDIERIKDRTYVGHEGAYPGNTTQTLAQLDDKIGVIVLTNASDSNPNEIARELMATVGVAAVGAAGGKPASTVAWDPSWERFAGLYRGRGGEQQVILLNHGLVLLAPNSRTIQPVTLEPLGGGRFRYVSPKGGGPFGEVVRFVEEAGKPMRIYIGDNYIDRLSTP